MGGEIGVKNVVYNAPKGERKERHNKKKKKGGEQNVSHKSNKFG